MGMNREYESLPFRKNVCLITYRDGKFLLVNLIYWKEDWWKFPQGGMKVGESEEAAAKREFLEELGTDKIEIVGQSTMTNRYEWSNNFIEKREMKWKGQAQRFLLVRFLGSDEDLKPNQDEVRAFRWATREEVMVYSYDKMHMFFRNYNHVIPKILDEFEVHLR
jgi:putative (di)nucleoside polyphosphate hydrolase